MDDCLFCKIVFGDIPCDKIFESELLIAFRDIAPVSPTHILIIPKEQYCSFDDFSKEANDKTICTMIRCIPKITRKLKIENGYRLVTNIGTAGGQEVPHFHVHLLSGGQFGKILP